MKTEGKKVSKGSKDIFVDGKDTELDRRLKKYENVAAARKKAIAEGKKKK